MDKSRPNMNKIAIMWRSLMELVHWGLVYFAPLLLVMTSHALS